MKANEKLVRNVLEEHYPQEFESIYESSPLIRYLEYKTQAMNASSKARGSFANLYAIYVLVEDYVNKKFHLDNGKYSSYEGMRFKEAFNRQRELPFGAKLQNHALNHRCNQEFSKKYSSETSAQPILRKSVGRYWINEQLVKVQIDSRTYNIAETVLKIIDRYVEARVNQTKEFISKCRYFKKHLQSKRREAKNFVLDQISPDKDARIFEIVSFCILKHFYSAKHILIGESKDSIEKVSLQLYKTGRTNANDGGIDFVMLPLGRVFQVTESLDFEKFFLDIGKLKRFPITFVIKRERDPNELYKEITEACKRKYENEAIRKEYMSCFEEIVTIPTLRERLDTVLANDLLASLLDELIKQYEFEFHF